MMSMIVQIVLYVQRFRSRRLREEEGPDDVLFRLYPIPHTLVDEIQKYRSMP